MGRELDDARHVVDGAMQIGQRDGYPVNQWPGELAEECIHIAALRPSAILEIGVQAGGWGWVATHFAARPCVYIPIDINYHDGWPAAKRAIMANGVTIEEFNASSQSPATVQAVQARVARARDKSLDLVHIDGSHVSADALRDYDLWNPLVRPGGMVCMHDIFSGKGPSQTLHDIINSDRVDRIKEIRTICETHNEWRERRMGIAMIRY